MKKLSLLLLAAFIVITGYRCTPSSSSGTPSFTFTVEEDSAGFINAPGLQSFVLGVSDSGKWLMFGGRTNGFHGFGTVEDFPFKKANKFIYVYDPATHALDSMHTSMLPQAVREQFYSSNMACRQIDSFLYVCGGYGQVKEHTPDSTWTTHNIIARVHIQHMISAVQNHDSAALAASIAYDISDVVRCTGGELYKMPDGKFYLVVGHDFEGAYADSFAVQKYLDSVHVFTLNETANSIQVGSTVQYVSDGLNDSVTQYHRRDLVVAPSVLAGGQSYGITIYGGVFTYTPGYPTNPNSNEGGTPFQYPIYITPGNTPSGRVDSSFLQLSNVYSAPNLQFYDSANDGMYTTIFGGLADTGTNFNQANFTKLILTLNRNNKNDSTRSIYNATGMPLYIGAEGTFIRANNNYNYNNNTLGIFDYAKIPTGGQQLLGYIYGGIYSTENQWHQHANPTYPSNKVYKVYITKN